MTSLHYVAWYGHLSVVECLINQKADINATNNWFEFLILKRLLFI